MWSPRALRFVVAPSALALVIGGLDAIALSSHAQASSTFTQPVLADATIAAASSTTNAGSANPLVVDGSPVDDVMLKFAFPASCPSQASVTAASLTMVNDADGSADRGQVFAATDGWTESTVTWGNAPAAGG